VAGNQQPRIVSLHRSLTELVALFSLSDLLVGEGGAGCKGGGFGGDTTKKSKLPFLTEPFEGTRRKTLAQLLCNQQVDLRALTELSPSIVCTITPSQVDLGGASSSLINEVVINIEELRAQLRGACENDGLKLLAYDPRRFEQILEMIGDFGRGLGVAAAGRDRAQRLKAQALDWGQNFYDRMKNKRVVVLSSIDPLLSAGNWVPDLIKLACAQPMEVNPGQDDREITWNELEAFRPDVIVVAPRGASLKESVALLPVLEKVPAFERMPATKRGEVIFASGDALYAPGYGLVNGISMLFSSIAGLESGYITERDSFYRLRYVELHRHKLFGKT